MTPPIRPGPAAAATPSMSAKVAPRLAHRGRDDDVEHLDMGARRDLRHHAAERRMLLDLRQHHVGEDGAAPVRVPLDHRRRGFIAGRLDAEHDHGGLARVLRFAFLRRRGAYSSARVSTVNGVRVRE